MRLGKYVLLTAIVFITSYFAVWQRNMTLSIVSSVFTVALAIPAILGCIKWLGVKKGLLLLVTLSIFSFAIESIGLWTHFPYGQFAYTEKVGLLIFDFLPATLPLAWVPLLLGAFSLSKMYKKSFIKSYVFAISWLVGIDIVLDPGAVFLGFWEYAEQGIWYNVPFSNFFGWFLSGTIGFVITYFLVKNSTSPPVIITFTYLFSLIFWLGVSIFGKLWGSALVGLILLIAYLYVAKSSYPLKKYQN